MIFAAGLGKRLGKITENIPKALVQISGKSALQIAIERCTSFGFDDIIVNKHHFADMIEDEVVKLNRNGFRITVSDEREKLLDTGGGLYNARAFFDNTPFLIYNVDIISDLNLASLYAYHLEKKGLATLAVRDRPANRVFLINNSGSILGWRNRSTGEEKISRSTGEVLSEIAFSGIHIIEPEIFNYMREGVYSMTDLYLRLAQNHNIYTFRDDKGFWCDIGTPDNLLNIRKFVEGED